MEPAAQARGLRPATVRYASEPVVVSERVLASWRRSEGYGVSPEEVEPFFAGTVDHDSLFFECGREVLDALHRTLAAEPISLMLTDAEGLVLSRLSGDLSLLRALDDVHLAPGFSYAEREAGTNGLGLALADRLPTLVRAEEHYSASLCTYTCAAVPVLDPVTGRLEGAVNITTWARSSTDLLLALAQSAASTTTALMLARSEGRRPRPSPRGQVFRVEPARLEPGCGTVRALSTAWTDAVDVAAAALRAGQVVGAVGEPGSGRTTLLAQALRRVRPRDRILNARAPAPEDVQGWLSVWGPELGKPHTAVVVGEVDALPAWAAERLRDRIAAAASAGNAAAARNLVAVTAEQWDGVPPSIAAAVDAVVTVPPLRERAHDVVPLAAHLARKARGREVNFTPAALRALQSCGWPGNVEQLARVVRDAATRADVVDVRHLPAEVLSGSARRLTRLQAYERDELVRCLSRAGATVKSVAAELGMSRATVYRKIAQYDVHVPRP